MVQCANYNFGTRMKFQPDTFLGTNAVTRHESGAVWVNGERFAGSVLVPWKGSVAGWPVASLDGLAPAHFEAVLALRPELVIFGSGRTLRFIAPARYRALIDARIGMETMDTAAACRTYNVLAAEGRSVVAALLIEAVVDAA
jgi:uncharacterized protein